MSRKRTQPWTDCLRHKSLFFRGSFVFSQSRVKASTSLANIGSLAVGAFDSVDCSLSVVRFVSVFHVGQ